MRVAGVLLLILDFFLLWFGAYEMFANQSDFTVIMGALTFGIAFVGAIFAWRMILDD